jgi:hypothetical protein
MFQQTIIGTKGVKETPHMHPAHILTGFKIRFAFPDRKSTVRETKSRAVL